MTNSCGNFLYCFNEETKLKLITNGYKFIKEVKFQDKTGFLFANNGIKLTFDKSEVLYTNKLYF